MAYKNTYNVKSVDSKTYHRMEKDTPICISQINACQSDTSVCAAAQSYCNGKLFGLVNPPVFRSLFRPARALHQHLQGGAITFAKHASFYRRLASDLE
jgi:hypothetical protein